MRPEHRESGVPRSRSRERRSSPFREGPSVLRILVPRSHQLREPLFVAAANRLADGLDRFSERIQRLRAEIVEMLDLEIESGALACHIAGDIELGIERGAR